VRTVSKKSYLGVKILRKWPQNSKWRQKPVFSLFFSQNLNFQPNIKIGKNASNAFQVPEIG
jgi:hypothetical protein